MTSRSSPSSLITGTLGMVRQWQTLIYDERYSQTDLDRGPDFVKLAEAYGIAGYRVTKSGGVRGRLPGGAGLRSRPLSSTACIDMDEMVHPMVRRRRARSPTSCWIKEVRA